MRLSAYDEVRGTFLNQLSLALALVGNVLTVKGITEAIFPEVEAQQVLGMLLVHGLVGAGMYLLYAHPIYRFLAPIGLVILAVIWIILEETMGVIHGLIGAETLLIGILLVHGMHISALKPLFYAAIVALPVTTLFITLVRVVDWSEELSVALWPSSGILAISLITLLGYTLGSLERIRTAIREPWFLIAMFAIVFLNIFTAPGILVACGLLGIGFVRDDRVITGLGYVFLATFLVLFYYALNIDLAYKSGILLGSGLVLLSVRWFLSILNLEERVA